MNMLLVYMSANDKRMVPFCQRHSVVIADLVRQFRRDLPRLEGLPQMVGDHIIIFLFPAGNDSIPTLCKKELLISDGRIALIGSNQSAAVSFLWIFHIVCYSIQCFRNGSTLAAVQRH